MNGIVVAHQKLRQHIETFTGNADSVEKRREDLLKLSKEELVEILLKQIKVTDIKIEDVAKVILEDPDCAWLDYSQIAEAICVAIPSAKTSNKSLASYASKNPRDKGWNVVGRKSNSERSTEMAKLVKF